MLSGICETPEDDYKEQLKEVKESLNPKVEYSRNGMPPPETIFDKKALFKNYGYLMKVPLPSCTVASGSATKSMGSSL